MEAPPSSAACANSKKFSLDSSQPVRNLTETGISVESVMILTTSVIKAGFFIIAEPAPVLVTLGTGHPQFMSMTSQW